MLNLKTLRCTLEAWSEKYALTAQERSLLEVACTVTSNVPALAILRGTACHVVRNQAQSLCSKTGDKRLAQAALRALRESHELAMSTSESMTSDG